MNDFQSKSNPGEHSKIAKNCEFNAVWPVPIIMEPVDHGVGLEVQLERQQLNGLLGRVWFQLISFLQGFLLFRSQDYPWLLDLQETEIL